ncbi:MAG TPA: alkaline phosphatase family protein [Acidimicrobiales bacterium]|nr:alkaline phosphatase family protein [Acidimicrobiales bacterium]
MSDAAAPGVDAGPTRGAPSPVLPDYGGACLTSVVPALMASVAAGSGSQGRPDAPDWLPAPAQGARQVVLLVLDGLGWEQLQSFSAAAPTLASASGGPITSVAPTTTATALTSLTTGAPPSVHGIVGYRVRVDLVGMDAGGPGEVMNVLRWRTSRGDMRRRLPAPRFQSVAPFGGRGVPAVTRSEFASTGFTAAHLTGARLHGWSVPSALVVNIRQLLGSGESFVYAYYDGLDKVAHEYGLGDHYVQELASVDRLVGDLLGVLPPGAVLAVTSDHGQVEVGNATRLPAPALFDMVDLFSGEGRFRWLHVRPGSLDDAVATATEVHGGEAWVRTRQEMVDEGWFGGPITPEITRRLGDLALVAHAPVAFLDPADTGETRLMGRHGSLTSAEMSVPFVAWASD